MIIVTGGAGFIGSALVWKLNELGYTDILVTDHLGSSEKWKNLVNLNFYDYMDRDQFIRELESGAFGSAISMIFHLGACSATTERNADYLMENNFHYTLRLAKWSLSANCRFVYASSAATYGAGEHGYSDDHREMNKLRPLNMYGYSKHLFDKYALKMGWLEKIAGLKFFNVFGPNEYHKGEMKSLVCKSFPLVQSEGKISLFKSYNEKYKDGEQLRDFIYIKDVVEIIMHFYEKKELSGIYNIGTGIEHTWNDVANALFKACGKKKNIEYVDMPEQLRAKYQYFTKADMTKLKKSGCNHQFWTLENAIDDYVNNYLKSNSCLGE